MNINYLVKLSTTGDCLSIRTYSREDGTHGRFLLIRDSVRDWLENIEHIEHIETDCGWFCTLRKRSEQIVVDLYWLNHGYRKVNGIHQTFYLPRKTVEAWVNDTDDDEPRMILANSEPESKTSVNVKWTDKLREDIIEKPHVRRAFSKFMRDHFQYSGNTKVTMYEDGWCAGSFAIRVQQNGWPEFNGGVILSTLPDRSGRFHGNIQHTYTLHT